MVGEAYVAIGTSGRYDGITGQLINHRGEIVKMAKESLPFLKIITSLDAYPPYAHNREVSEEIRRICRDALINTREAFVRS